jgi:hypothetical protein
MINTLRNYVPYTFGSGTVSEFRQKDVEVLDRLYMYGSNDKTSFMDYFSSRYGIIAKFKETSTIPQYLKDEYIIPEDFFNEDLQQRIYVGFSMPIMRLVYAGFYPIIRYNNQIIIDMIRMIYIEKDTSRRNELMDKCYKSIQSSLSGTNTATGGAFNPFKAAKEKYQRYKEDRANAKIPTGNEQLGEIYFNSLNNFFKFDNSDPDELTNNIDSWAKYNYTIMCNYLGDDDNTPDSPSMQIYNYFAYIPTIFYKGNDGRYHKIHNMTYVHSYIRLWLLFVYCLGSQEGLETIVALINNMTFFDILQLPEFVFNPATSRFALLRRVVMFNYSELQSEKMDALKKVYAHYYDNFVDAIIGNPEFKEIVKDSDIKKMSHLDLRQLYVNNYGTTLFSWLYYKLRNIPFSDKTYVFRSFNSEDMQLYKKVEIEDVNSLKGNVNFDKVYEDYVNSICKPNISYIVRFYDNLQNNINIRFNELFDPNIRADFETNFSKIIQSIIFIYSNLAVYRTYSDHEYEKAYLNKVKKQTSSVIFHSSDHVSLPAEDIEGIDMTEYAGGVI